MIEKEVFGVGTKGDGLLKLLGGELRLVELPEDETELVGAFDFIGDGDGFAKGFFE